MGSAVNAKVLFHRQLGGSICFYHFHEFLDTWSLNYEFLGDLI